jgi:hypothetical protein
MPAMPKPKCHAVKPESSAQSCLDQRVADADRTIAVAAAAPLQQIAEDRQVLEGADGWPQWGQREPGVARLKRWGFGLSFLTPQGRGLGLPLAFHHERQAVDDHVEKAAYEQADQGAGGREDERILECFHRAAGV